MTHPVCIKVFYFTFGLKFSILYICMCNYLKERGRRERIHQQLYLALYDRLLRQFGVKIIHDLERRKW